MSWEGVGHAAKMDGRMDSGLYCAIMEDELLGSIKYFKKKRKDTVSSFSKTMTQNTRAN